MNSTRLRADLTGSSSRKPVRLAQAGNAQAAEHAVGEQVGGSGRELLRNPERHPVPGVDRAAERDQRAEALVAAVGGGLVTEHPALRVAAEVHVAPGLRSRTRSTASETASTWSASVRSSPPASRSGIPKSTTHGSAPWSRRIVTALVAGETS